MASATDACLRKQTSACFRYRSCYATPLGVPLRAALRPRVLQAVSDRVPFIADLKPSGKFVMEDLHKVSTSRIP